MSVIGLVIAVVAFIIIGWIFMYNSLVRHRNWVREAWSQIDVQLKRRYDLIPNLVNTVKGYAKHEQETLNKVIEARNKLLSGNTRAEKIEANDALTESLKHLFALKESYPELRSSENFLRLQEQLEGTENKIAAARQMYNTTVMEYNTKVQSFPSSLVAALHGFREEELLKIKEEERENVHVTF